MKAYEVLEKYGWVRGSFGNKQDGFCAVGALRQAYPEFPCDEFGEAMDKLRAHMGVTTSHSFLSEWNDRQTSSRVVIDTFKLLDL